VKPLDCDVLVVGGGAAGVAAATAAGRAGSRVILLERYGFLGGLATAGLVGTVCGLFLRDPSGAGPRLVAGGFVREFALRLKQCDDRQPIALPDGLWVLPFSSLTFEKVTDELLVEAGNVTLGLHAVVTSVEVQAARIEEVRALAWNDEVAIRPRSIVDCTGEATVVKLAGGAVVDGGREQVPALIFVMEKVDHGFDEQGMLEVWCALSRAVEETRLPPGSERLTQVPGQRRDGRVVFKLNLPSLPDREEHWRNVTTWEREGRRRVRAIESLMRETIPAFRLAQVSHVAAQLGVRTGRRIQGHCTLTDQAVLGGRKCTEGIARGCWPMEVWSDSTRPTMTFLEAGDYYDIPLGCLRPVAVENAWAAGRCISAESGAMASARVIGTAIGTGWAAGHAAALEADGLRAENVVGLARESAET